MTDFAFPPGTYFIGDITHVLTDDQVDAVFMEYGVELLVPGVGQIVQFCMPDTGCFNDVAGNEYECPSGSLAVVPVEHLSAKQLVVLGQVGMILISEESFQAQLDSEGNFSIGSLRFDMDTCC